MPPDDLTARRKREAQIEQLLRLSRGDIGRAKRTGQYTGCWSDADVDRVVERLRGPQVARVHDRTSSPMVAPPIPPSPTPAGLAPLELPPRPADPEPVAPTGGWLLPEVPSDIPQPRLTERQYEVLQHLCTGQSNRQIGEQLYLSEDTVKSHLKAVLSALGAHDRTHAVALVLTGAVAPYHEKTMPEKRDRFLEADAPQERAPKKTTAREQELRSRLLAELADVV